MLVMPYLVEFTIHVDSMVPYFIASLWWLRGGILILSRGVMIFIPRSRGREMMGSEKKSDGEKKRK